MYTVDEIVPGVEAKRVEVLKEYEILDTPPDEGLNILTKLAARLFDLPIALISFVDSERIWFKSQFGLEVQEIDRVPGFCASAISEDDFYVVENAEKDPRTRKNPMVAGEKGIKFYAAIPIKCKEGLNLGTFCVMDRKPRSFSTVNKEVLQGLANLVRNHLELRQEARLAMNHQHHILNTTAHDLKNPVSILPLLADLIMEHKNDPKAIDDIAQQIKETGRRMTKIIDELLIEAMEDAGRIHLQLRAIDLTPVVLGVVNANAALAKNKGQELKLVIEKDCKVYADALRLTEILDNLVNNAIKFSFFNTNINITVTVGKECAIIDVKDEGPGLTKDDMKNLYRRFTSLSALPTGGEKSTGLGLSIVKKLVAAHRGKLIAKSEGQGKGTSFKVELPLSETS